MKLKSKRLASMLIAVAAILAAPGIAMQFTSEVNWSASDFVIMAILLTTTAVFIEIVLQKVHTRLYKIIMCMIVLTVFLLLYVEMAVGLFGSPIAGS
ncbi:MAG: hypothetical protein INR69_13120 [Mucilaginibacter polytrichastri]|nr:hypothetical protein [Mucilaginibacter polytrichastri]